MSYNSKNYFEQGGEILHIGEIEFEGGGLMPNQAASTATSVADIKGAFNSLLTKLKNAGLMAGDTLTVTAANSVVDSVAGHADRTYNTGKISAVAIEDDVITITLSEKIANLKDFDGGSGWGVHKWLGIAVGVTGITDITNLVYNGSALTSADVEEATACGVSNAFVRWVAADDLPGKSKKVFTLTADGYEKKTITIKIAEPEDGD